MSLSLPEKPADLSADGAPVDVSIVMPCLNEAASLGHCISNARAALAALDGLRGEIIVADNGSTDGSAALAEALGVRVVLVAQRGYGAAVSGGCAAARGGMIVIGDADGSYDFADAVAMIAALRNGADICVGSRFHGGIQPKAMPWKNRYIGNPVLTFTMNLLFATRIADAHCGLRAMTRDAFAALRLDSTGMELASEMLAKASLGGLRIAQVPVSLAPDLRGRPPHLRPWRDGGRHLRCMLRLRLGGDGLSARFLAKLYLCAGLPILLGFCCLTGPFQVPDEMAHYFRTVQISHGQISPVPGPDGHSAGGMVDAPAISLAEDIHQHTLQYSLDLPRARRDIAADNAADRAGPLAYVSFSNTVIYFPAAYALPAAAIAVARYFGAPPLAWLYLGRLVNASVALLVSAWAISLFGEGALFACVLSLLPRVMFQEASLSADALVIPFALLFWALIGRLARREGDGWPGFLLASIYVCVGKFAYIPMVVLPALVAAMERRGRVLVLRLAAVAGFALICWVAWSLNVHDEVFPIGIHQGVVNPHLQLRWVLRHPGGFFVALAGSFGPPMLVVLRDLVSPNIGWVHRPMPWPFIAMPYAVLFAAAALRRPGGLPRPAIRLATAGVLLACWLAIYLLLYLNFTPLGAPRVDGVQGRYLIPLIAAVPLLVPGVKAVRWRSAWGLLMVALIVFGDVATMVTIWWRCWRI